MLLENMLFIHPINPAYKMKKLRQNHRIQDALRQQNKKFH